MREIRSPVQYGELTSLRQRGGGGFGLPLTHRRMNAEGGGLGVVRGRGGESAWRAGQYARPATACGGIRGQAMLLADEGKEDTMITLAYSLVIEATEDPDFFGFYSPDLEGFTGVGHSVEDCLYQARWGMADHVQTLREQGMAIPANNPNPTIIIQNDRRLQAA